MSVQWSCNFTMYCFARQQAMSISCTIVIAFIPGGTHPKTLKLVITKWGSLLCDRLEVHWQHSWRDKSPLAQTTPSGLTSISVSGLLTKGNSGGVHWLLSKIRSIWLCIRFRPSQDRSNCQWTSVIPIDWQLFAFNIVHPVSTWIKWPQPYVFWTVDYSGIMWKQWFPQNLCKQCKILVSGLSDE